MQKFLIGLFLIAIIFIAKKIKVRVFTPGGMFLLIWCSMIIFAVFLWTPNYEWNYEGVFWILGACFFCEIGIYLGSRYRKKYYETICSCVNSNVSLNNLKITKSGWRILTIYIALALIQFIASFLENGFSLSDLLNFSKYIEKVLELNSAKYEDGSGSSYISQILLVFMYVAPMCGGFCYVYARSWKQYLLCLSSIVPMFLLAALTTAKSGLIAATGLWIIGMTFAKLFCYRKDDFMSKSSIVNGVVALIAILFILYCLMLIRANDFSFKTMNLIKDKFFVYAFGGIPSFDNWFGNYRDGGYGFGKYTFRAIASYFIDIDRKSGVYSLLPGYSDSNIYTMFRPLIDDFGVYGALFICGLIGYTSSRFCNIIKTEKNKHYLVILAYTALYFYVFWGFIISAWVYTSYMLIFPAFMVFFVIATNTKTSRYSIETRKYK